MNIFPNFVTIILVLLMIAVVLVLGAGVIAMAVGGKLNPRFRNKLMRVRVILQTIILAVIAISFLAHLFEF